MIFHAIMTAQEWEQKLKEEKFDELWVQTDPPGRLYEAHSHPVDTAHVVLEGSMTVWVGEKDHVVKVGERLDVAKQVTHTATIGPEGCKFLIGIRM